MNMMVHILHHTCTLIHHNALCRGPIDGVAVLEDLTFKKRIILNLVDVLLLNTRDGVDLLPVRIGELLRSDHGLGVVLYVMDWGRARRAKRAQGSTIINHGTKNGGKPNALCL